MCLQWEAYQIPTAKLEPYIGVISPVMVGKKHSGEVDQLTLAGGGSEHAYVQCSYLV